MRANLYISVLGNPVESYNMDQSFAEIMRISKLSDPSHQSNEQGHFNAVKLLIGELD